MSIICYVLFLFIHQVLSLELDLIKEPNFEFIRFISLYKKSWMSIMISEPFVSGFFFLSEKMKITLFLALIQ